MTTPVEKRNNNKFCEFHEEVGHNTDECMHLRRQIEELIKSGKLSHVIKELKQGDEDRTEGPMSIEAEIGGHFIHIMYVDGGSASKILYRHCFNRLRPKVKNQMVPATAPLTGFSGEIIWPMGQILLPITISIQWDHRKAESEEDSSSPVNSSRNSKIPGLRRNTHYAEQHDHPTRMHDALRIRSSTITEEGRKTLYELLRRNLDIFSWKPADMTWVSRHIVEHNLNVHEGCSPVRQKKRSQAPERNKSIQEERMYVDFKDLNKACPKDGYPLSKIDWKVESLYGYPFKCFLDAYKGYHQIKMAKEDEEKIAFITSQGIFSYSKMPFGLKNARVTYQRLVDKAF
ncbi:hypothetical protein Tco_1305140 [Tanacetum coccineum]